jgi:hypothetical protein
VACPKKVTKSRALGAKKTGVKSRAPGAEKTEKTKKTKKACATAAKETREHIPIRKGLQPYDSEDSLEFVVFTREKQWLEDDEGVPRFHDGVYYHALGADHVDENNYKEECYWSSLDEAVEWALASRRGDGVTGNLDPFAKDWAEKYTVHPLVRENLDAPGGFWSREGDCNQKALKLGSHRAASALCASSGSRTWISATLSTSRSQSDPSRSCPIRGAPFPSAPTSLPASPGIRLAAVTRPPAPPL